MSSEPEKILEVPEDVPAEAPAPVNVDDQPAVDAENQTRAAADIAEAPQYLGHVVSVSGSEALVVLESGGDNGPRTVMGNLVRLPVGNAVVFGIISGMMVPVPKAKREETEIYVAQIDLVGEATLANEGELEFAEGVSSFPALGDGIFTATSSDLHCVFGRQQRPTACIGVLHQDHDVAAELSVDDLLGKHFAILGNTGTGKSCAATVILRATLSKLEYGHVLILDPHNEYSRALEDKAVVFDVNSLELPFWLLNGEELKEVIISSDSKFPEDEAAILSDLIPEAKRRFSGEPDESMMCTIDTPVPYRMTDFYNLLDKKMGSLEKAHDLSPYKRIKARFKALQADARYGFMFKGLAIRDNLANILGNLFRVPVGGKPATIVDLSGVPSEILNVVVSLLSRITFDFGLWNEQKVPVLLVCEEAHRYAPHDKTLGFQPATRALARIAKEGRKYGVSLCVISQRPAELDMSVLSQCNTIFALRTNNQTDRDFVRSAISQCGTTLLEFLPSLRTGEAIVTGAAARVPMRLIFDQLDEKWLPRSRTAEFSDAWSRDMRILSLDNLVERWRTGRKIPDSGRSSGR